MHKRIWIRLISITIIAILATLIVIPNGPDLKIGKYYRALQIKQGLDLKGGTQLTYQADMSQVAAENRAKALSSLVDVIDRRINALGVSEPIIQTSTVEGKDSVLVELPGVQDVQQATNLIGRTAQLTFYSEGTNAAAEGDNPLGNYVPTELTGAFLSAADVTFQDPTGQQSAGTAPVVSLQFNAKGAELFQKLTRENVGKTIAVVLDNQILTAPVVQGEISGGQAVITGTFTLDEAKELARLLNAGALPVPVTLVSERTIGPTLGEESIRRSLVAGSIGLIAISIFMLAQYRKRGLFALIALVIYTLIVLALFKLIPVTLTLAGIAGFILSVGMAIDANILIFERMKEEERAGKTPTTVLEEGFRRAWLSVRDSNLSSLMTAAILIWLGSGVVRGFAVTLSIGILVSMFTAVTVTRTLLAAFGTRRAQ